MVLIKFRITGFKIIFSYRYLFVYHCVCVCVYTQFAVVSSLLLPCGTQETNSGSQALVKIPTPIKASPKSQYLNKY